MAPDSPTWLGRALPLAVVMAALALLLVTLEIYLPGYFLHDDNSTWFTPAYVHDSRVLAQTGRVAEVNYFQYGGEPFLEQGQTAVLYPPVYLGVALAKWISGDTRWSIEWIAAGHLLLGLAGFNFWLRQIGVGRWFAALGGLAWVLQPFVFILAASWIIVTYVAAWLPWLFWAFERSVEKRSAGSAVVLGAFTGLFFLQGYAQWVVYALFFLGLYALFQFYTRREIRRGEIVLRLAQAVLVFLALAAPLLLPMLHAMVESAARSRVVDMQQRLFYRLELGNAALAQIGKFRPFMFGVSTSIFFCPALLLVPIAIMRFCRADAKLRRPLFVLLVLGGIALILSTRWYFLLSVLPLMDKLRWPFKLFIDAEFFLLTALVLSVWSRTKPRIGVVILLFVLAAELTVSLARHESLSQTTLPESHLPLPIDTSLGRVVAIDDILPEASAGRFLTHAYATYYEVPSIGGYNPLVSYRQLAYGLGLDFPNVYSGRVTLPFRRMLQSRAVRYWIVDPHSSQRESVAGLDGLKLLATEPGREIYEDIQAPPMAYSSLFPATPCPIRYRGNSLFVSLEHVTSPLRISLGPTDGWMFRFDRGPWLETNERGFGLTIDFPSTAKMLELSYFDPRFRRGLTLSAMLLVTLLLSEVTWRAWRRRSELGR